MDLYVERQAIDQMKAGEPSKFMLLFDAYFPDLYKYVYRRVADRNKAEEIVRLTFLDAIGQMQNTPTDVGYPVWLYSLARPRVWDYLSRSSMPEKRGLIYAEDEVKGQEDKEDLVEKANKLFNKLSLEEREILRLKFFEEVSDGDVMVVLGMEEGTIGPKIYRVLKRAHFLLFGESDEGQGVYFGELSGFLARIREIEKIEIPEVFKLSLKTDLAGRIERRDFAIDVEPEQEEKIDTSSPFEEKPKGSNDPAKIFVDAVREMRQEEEQERERERRKQEKRERMYDFVDRRRGTLILIPILLFIVVLGIVGWNLFKEGFDFNFGNGDDQDGLVAEECDFDVQYVDEFADENLRVINRDIVNRICEEFEVRELIVSNGDSRLEVRVDIPEWNLQYIFVEKMDNDWRIRKYERNPDSNEESG